MSSVSVLSQPQSIAPCYKHNELVWEFECKCNVVSVSNAGGDFRLELDDAQKAAEALDAGFVYWSELDGADGFDNAVSVVKSAGGALIVLDEPFQSGFANGFIRVFRRVTFVIETGDTTNMLKQEVTMLPDMKGVYSLNTRNAVSSRFDYLSEPLVNDKHQIGVRVYEKGESAPAYVKSVKTVDGLIRSKIRYTGIKNLITGFNGVRYVVGLESDATMDKDIDTHNVFKYVDDTVRINLLTPLDTGTLQYNGSATPPPYITPIFDAGQLVTILIKKEEAGYEQLLIKDDINAYGFEIFAQSYFAEKKACEGTRLVWWDAEGGYSEYIFTEQNRVGFTKSNGYRVLNKNNANVVGFDNQYKTITLNARPEMRSVFDFLNDIYKTLEVFVFDGENYVTHFYEEADVNGFTEKRFRPTNNTFSITLTKSEKLTRINQSL